MFRITDLSFSRPAWAELSRAALRNNYRILREQAARADADMVAVIKANAYGHGAPEALTVLDEEGCPGSVFPGLDDAPILQPQPKNHRTLIFAGLFEGEAPEGDR